MAYKDSEKTKARTRKYRINNKDKINARAREYYAKNKDRLKARFREYRLKNRDRASAYSREYRVKNRDRLSVYNRAYNREYRVKNKDRLREYCAKNKDRISAYNRTYIREYRTKNRDQIRVSVHQYRAKNKDRLNALDRERRAKERAKLFAEYGKECVCGQKDTRFLTLGHKNNDGNVDRRENGGHDPVLRLAIRHPDHARYEIQCYNCQRLAWLNHLADTLVKKTYANNCEKAKKKRAHDRERHRKDRQRQFDIYGSVCACCGVTDQRVLELAHKSNDGKEDRLNNGGFHGMHRRAIMYPDHSKYEILCANCNQGANANGGVCPHRVDRMKNERGLAGITQLLPAEFA